MVFGFFGYLFSYRRKIFKLRKRYDRTREKVDKLKEPNKRLQILRMLDQIEPTLVMLEEQNISRFERGRMKRQVERGIEQARFSIKQPLAYQPPQVQQTKKAKRR